jgi:DNA ligase-1
MLANKFAEKGHNIRYPCLAQPKLDGIRYSARKISPTEIQVRTRNDGPCHFFNEIKQALLALDMPADLVLDGEFYSRRIPFRTLNGHCNRKSLDGVHGFNNISKLDLESIQYHLFDCYFINTPQMPFVERHAFLVKLLEHNQSPFLQLVQVHPIAKEAEIKPLHDQFVTEGGYEGIMIRNIASAYKLKDRSNDLLKFKVFQDSEFTIVDCIASENGKEQNLIIYVLQVPGTELTFNCRPRDTHEARRVDYEIFQTHPENFIGKKYMVRYQECYENGVPRFPVGIAIRYDV